MILLITCFNISVILRVTGGEGAATAALAPKIGPLGLVSLDFVEYI
jgi:ribosomal protein L11